MTENRKAMDQENELSDELVEVLKFITFSEGSVHPEDVAGQFSISKPKAQYFLDELQARDYVERSAIAMAGDSYWVTKGGRKFLFDKGML